MLGVAMIGCGRVAELHQIALGEAGGYELHGVYDVDDELARGRASAWGTNAYPTLEAVLADESVDAVLVLTHVDSHLEIARRAVDAGKHVLIEKPVAEDGDAIEALAAHAAAHGMVVMPGHNYVYIPEFRRLLRLAKAGDLGSIRSFFVFYAIHHDEDIARDYSGVLDEVMIHHTYCTTAVLGAPERVIAGTAEPEWETLQTEDQAWAVWDYGRGVTAHHFCTFATPDESNEPWSFLIKVLGTDGSAVVNWRTSQFQRALGTLSFAIPAYEESFTHTLEAFRRAVVDGERLPSDLGDAAAAARLLSASHEAARERRFIERAPAGSGPRW